MTCISSAPYKRLFKESVDSTDGRVTIEDPSIYTPFYGNLRDHPDLAGMGGFIAVTNHPGRDWFASVFQTSKGLVVK